LLSLPRQQSAVFATLSMMFYDYICGLVNIRKQQLWICIRHKRRKLMASQLKICEEFTIFRHPVTFFADNAAGFIETASKHIIYRRKIRWHYIIL
jgi:hypothetical protein